MTVRRRATEVKQQSGHSRCEDEGSSTRSPFAVLLGRAPSGAVHLLGMALLISSFVFALVAPSGAWAIDAGVPLTTPFPRVCIWTPDTTVQSLDDLAKYDYVALYDGQSAAIPKLKALNPKIIVLNLSSAAEVALWHPLIAKIPNEWFLSQVGTRLSSHVDSTTVTFPVQDTSVFAAQQIASIEDELVEIVSVGSGYVTVKRGVKSGVANAGAHASGVRIAPLVTRHYGIIDMDLSTYCPRVDVDPGDSSVGPESWGEFMARLTAERCESGGWDGVAVDRVENSESFLVRIAPISGLIKSIDPTRLNRRVTDDYAAFDKAWIAGVRHHLEIARDELGSHRIVVANNGAPHHDLINGSNIESFPRFDSRELPAMSTPDSYPEWWSTRRAFYSDWARKGSQPNLSTVMTYYYEPTPVPDQPLTPKGDMGPADYQKMRFGLATALMDDGFFTYQLRVWGTRIGMFWFDEYDNSGQSKGYLCLPISDARPALPKLVTADLLGGDGSFSTATKFQRWRLYVPPGSAAVATLTNRTARVSVTKVGRSDGVIFYHSDHSIKRGSEYTVSFRARADRAGTIRVRVATKDAPWNDWIAFYSVPVDTSWRTYEYSAHSKGADTDARLVFSFGDAKQTVWLDDVKLQSGSRLNVYRRDFDGGAVLVNGSGRAVTIPLGTTFRKIAGDEVPAINDGSAVTSVSLPANDGLVLLKASAEARVPTYLSAKTSSVTPALSAETTISGTLRHTTSTGSGVAAVAVKLQSSYNGKTSWKTLAQSTTSTNGSFSYKVNPNRKTFYRVTYSGRSGAYWGKVSSAIVVTPRASVGTPRARTTMSHSRYYTVYGFLKPKHASGSYPVRIYMWKKTSTGKWKRYGYVSARASDYSSFTKYSKRMRLPSAGKWRLRAYAPADSRHSASWSSRFDYVTVK